MSLPAGWEFSTVGQIGYVCSGVGFPKSFQGRQDGQHPVFKVGDISRAWLAGELRLSEGQHYLNDDEVEALGGHLIPAESTVFAKIGAALLLNRRVILGVEALVDNNVMAVTPSAGVAAKYLLYFMMTQRLGSSSRGGVVPSLRQSDVKNLDFPLAPFPEQCRIVAKIEELFSELDAGTQALERAQAKLERYRASVLKAAVEGRLTEQWRKENPTQETGQELLDRLLVERRACWEEAQLAKYEAKGEKPPNNWQARYKEPVGPDTEGLPELPDVWCWGTVDQVFVNHDGRRVPLKRADRDQRSGPYPYYGASGVIDDIDDYLFDGDYLLLGEDGANLVTRSKPIAFMASGKFWVNNHAHVLEPVGPLSIGYAQAFFNGLNLQFYVTGSAQPKLPQRTLNRIPIPIPGDREQQVIVERLGHALDGSLSTSGELTRALRLSKTVRQTILKRAFEGRLVPQDPSDKPASELLERISAQREAEAPKKKLRTKKTPQPELDL